MSVEIYCDSYKIVVRTEELSEQKSEELKATMAKTFGVDESTKIESEFISGSVSDEMKVDAAVATLIATLCMLLYIWIRFRKLSTGISAVLALVHDVTRCADCYSGKLLIPGREVPLLHVCLRLSDTPSTIPS